MALPLYLAMTAAEIHGSNVLPEKLAWMACHFSSYSTGLSNCPDTLPTGSILILNDRTPVQGHDPQAVADQLRQALENTAAEAVLLDFQRPDCTETAAIAKAILDVLPCPVGITEYYASDFSCPVFLSPPPLHQPLKEYLAPWQGRELWLDVALDSEIITVTPEGSTISPAPQPGELFPCHREETLHCRYHIAVTDTQARFTLFRTKECLAGLLAQAETLGVTQTIGLYQDLHDILK